MELGFYAAFDHKNDLEKVWKSRNKFYLVGFKVEKKNNFTILGEPKNLVPIRFSHFSVRGPALLSRAYIPKCAVPDDKYENTLPQLKTFSENNNNNKI